MLKVLFKYVFVLVLVTDTNTLETQKMWTIFRPLLIMMIYIEKKIKKTGI